MRLVIIQPLGLPAPAQPTGPPKWKVLLNFLRGITKKGEIKLPVADTATAKVTNMSRSEETAPNLLRTFSCNN